MAENDQSKEMKNLVQKEKKLHKEIHSDMKRLVKKSMKILIK